MTKKEMDEYDEKTQGTLFEIENETKTFITPEKPAPVDNENGSANQDLE